MPTVVDVSAFGDDKNTIVLTYWQNVLRPHEPQDEVISNNRILSSEKKKKIIPKKR